MVLKSILKKRPLPKNDELDGEEPLPTRIRLDYDVDVFFIPKQSAASKKKKPTKKSKVLNAKKISDGMQQIKPQNLDLPKPILNYFLKKVNGNVMKKLQRTCKYFYNKYPYCIVDEITENRIGIDDKTFSIPQSRMVNNIWILKSLNIEDERNAQLLDKIVRSDATTIALPNGNLSTNLFDILTKSKNVKLWEVDSTFISPGSKENQVTLEKLLNALPNAENIRATLKSEVLDVSKIIHSGKNKIQSIDIDFEGDDIYFDPDEYYKLFEKILAPNADVTLEFKFTNYEDSELCDKNNLKLCDDIVAKWKPANQRPEIFVGSSVFQF